MRDAGWDDDDDDDDDNRMHGEKITVRHGENKR